MKRLACLGILIGLAVPVAAWAAKVPVEASMVVVGTVTVNPDGSVKTYSIKGIDKLPPLAKKVVQLTVPHWEFEPVVTGGKAIVARTGMSLRIVADLGPGNKATVRVAGAKFGCNASYQAKSLLTMACPRGSTVEPLQNQPPSYPMNAIRNGVGGEVFLTLQVDRDGHVEKVAASQVDLYVRKWHADKWRKVLADSAIAVAKKWTFRVPTSSLNAAKDHWVVQSFVDYRLATAENPANNSRCEGSPAMCAPAFPPYGTWNPYIPGPVQAIPWAEDGSEAGVQLSNDAIAGDGVLFVPDARFVLKTPLSRDGSQS